MRELWRPKEKWTPFERRKPGNFGPDGFNREYLPYERVYENLTRAQLLDLLRDAKRFHWQALDLQRCGLEELPEELGDLPDLQVLYLGNSDSYRPCGDGNTFPKIPSFLGNLSNLRALQITRNPNISEIPASLGQLKKLELLYLSNTKITALPGFIGNLTNLQRLDLGGSTITALPDFIGNLTNLQKLSLWDTQITALPDSMQRLTKLSYLDLDGTPLAETIPPEIYDISEPQKVIRYVLEMQSKTTKKEYFNESKMVVVGQGSVGKSCLINRLLYDKFEGQHSTMGIDIEKWNFTHGGEKYTLNVWDFGGQEIYHSTHQFFLTHRTLYLLVWDALAEDEYGRLDYWLRTIQSLAGEDCPVLIVVNKCDEDVRRRQSVEQQTLDNYPQVKGVFYVSCKDGSGIDDLRRDILARAVKLPLMKTVWLEKWLTVRQELETLSAKKNFITYDEYTAVCERQEIDGEDALTLAKYLHDLGVVLYYHEDPLLRDLMILSTRWGTDAVYKTLDEQERTLKGRNGLLYYDDLPKIWDNAADYPPRYYPHLLHLMENFQLAFQVRPDRRDNTYLVAELLNVDPADPALPWPEGGEPLAFRWDYDFLPAGVMTRLIVSIHEHLETAVREDGFRDTLCWRKGAYLSYGSARARLELHSDSARKFLDARITGEHARDRRELLAVIRAHVRKINSRYQKIAITELVPCRCGLPYPHFFKYHTLLKAEEKGDSSIQCHESLDEVSIPALLDGVMPVSDSVMRDAWGAEAFRAYQRDRLERYERAELYERSERLGAPERRGTPERAGASERLERMDRADRDRLDTERMEKERMEKEWDRWEKQERNQLEKENLRLTNANLKAENRKIQAESGKIQAESVAIRDERVKNRWDGWKSFSEMLRNILAVLAFVMIVLLALYHNAEDLPKWLKALLGLLS